MFPAGSRLKGRAVVSNSSEQDRPIFASMSKSTDPRPPESRFLGIPERGPGDGRHATRSRVSQATMTMLFATTALNPRTHFEIPRAVE